MKYAVFIGNPILPWKSGHVPNMTHIGRKVLTSEANTKEEAEKNAVQCRINNDMWSFYVAECK